ncbi:hypothetical protein AB0I66_41075 [Streptomyces sp. NPDC050439]|uniref:hypothetical protein n=1 Tax=unclassified Streptomyces TaxID=2593676 RepID=UPI00343F9F61
MTTPHPGQTSPPGNPNPLDPHDEPDKPDASVASPASDAHPQAPWWWGIGPIGAGLLILAGIAWALWGTLGLGDADDLVAGYHGSKVVALGLVLLGGAVLERLRSRRSSTHEAEDMQND